MADDKSSESLSQITREDYDKLANFLKKVEEDQKGNTIDFDNSTGNGKWKLTADNATKYGTDGATCPTSSP